MKLVFYFLITLFFCGTLPASAQHRQELTYHKKQFRGVWIATVRNLDWPSEPGLSNKNLKKEYIRQLDLLKEIGMNAVIVQIRPTGDAMYPSDLEPWSIFLTGEQGKAPKGNFDPLNFIIEETHKRSMEFHAWFNPYRAVRKIEEADLASSHVYNRHPEWFVRYGDDTYFDAGIPPARKFVEKVIADVVTRYDIDAVHFDDYYYPYRLEGIEYPDTTSFRKYNRGYTEEEKGNWRRENINLLVSELYDTINQLKPWVHFGISPFGVWRNKSQDPLGSETHTLQTNYDDLYGDALAWLKNGWLDYILPQCYQFLGRPIMDYRVVTRWWNDNHYGVNYYIGQGPFRLGNPARGAEWTRGNEIDRQLYFNDSIPDLLGSAYFRSLTFMDNPLGVNDTLKSKFYKYPALPPASHHDLGRECEVKITSLQIKAKRNKIVLKWKVDHPERARYFVVYKNDDAQNPQNIIKITSNNSCRISVSDPDIIADNLKISVVDRYRVESLLFESQ